MPHCSIFLGFLLLAGSSSVASAQSGMWTLEGFPRDSDGYFAKRIEVFADGGRLRVTEWPGNIGKEGESLVTYYLGQSVVKVFTWNGERLGLVFESTEALPKAMFNNTGQVMLPSPYPALVNDESDIPCGNGCSYHARNVSFLPMDSEEFAPGGSRSDTFLPDGDIPLLTKQEFMERYRISPPSWVRPEETQQR